MRIELTGAQYDVLMAALDDVVRLWDQSPDDRSSNIATLLRAQGRVIEGWMEGTRR